MSIRGSHFEEKAQEECGIFGIAAAPGQTDPAISTYQALYALQHRGQDSAGIAVCLDGDISTLICPPVYLFQKSITFSFCIIIYVSGITTKHEPSIGHKKNISQHHHYNSFHEITSSSTAFLFKFCRDLVFISRIFLYKLLVCC